jgi:hypothetical protein
VSGHVTPAPGRHRVQLQLKHGRTLVTIASARADHAGRYRFVIRSPRASRAVYRVRVPATEAHATGTSPTLTLRTT